MPKLSNLESKCLRARGLALCTLWGRWHVLALQSSKDCSLPSSQRRAVLE